MNDEIVQQIEDLLEQAASYSHGPEEIDLLEQAVRLADTHQLLEYGFDARKRLMTAATFGGAPEKALVAFTWCIGQCDQNPDDFDSGDLLWEYKWVVSGLKQFPQISRAQIETAFEDMTKRYQEHGLSMRPIHKLRSMFGIHRGDTHEARRWQRHWRKTDRGFGNDCAACELHDQVEYLVFIGKLERGIELAEPLLNNRMRCAEIPHLTYAHLMLPYLKLGQIEEAYSSHRRGYRMIADNREFLSVINDHMLFLSLTGNHSRAVKLLEPHLIWALETSSPLRRYWFSRGAFFSLQLALENRLETLSLNLPKSFPLYRPEGDYSLSLLKDWFAQDALALAGKFDARNENTHLTDSLKELHELKQYARTFPIQD
jgi:hypothetical protein